MQGVGSVGYDVLNQMFYDENPAWKCDNSTAAQPGYPRVAAACAASPGVDVSLNQLYGVPFGTFEKSGFTVLVVQANMFKGMALAAPVREPRRLF
jgi:hypothetical protein